MRWPAIKVVKNPKYGCYIYEKNIGFAAVEFRSIESENTTILCDRILRTLATFLSCSLPKKNKGGKKKVFSSPFSE